MKRKFFLLSVFSLFLFLPIKTEAKEITVVIDPGHGGDNLGGQFENYVEKEMTMKTALSMKQHLEKFDDVTVLLTHENTSDPDLSLKKRADFAAKNNADFLFSLHYNKSLDNRLFGAEIWTSAFGECYAKGMQFGQIEMQQLTDIGLFDRGIKTRLNSRGSDYYGIIKHSVKNNIPCVIIEHCHMDQSNDMTFLNQEDAYYNFGVLDAEAVAKYFNLKSSALEEDYTDYAKQEITIPTDVMKPDLTPPDTVQIALIESDVEDMSAIQIMACDKESGINYYDYSTNGGDSYSDLQPWPFDSSTCIFQLPVSFDTDQNVIIRVYNRYDLFVNSNELLIPVSVPLPEETSQMVEEDNLKDTYQEITYTNISPVVSDSVEDNTMNIVLIILFVIIALTLIFTILFFINVMKHKKRKRRYK